MPVELLKTPVSSPKDIRLADTFLRSATSDFIVGTDEMVFVGIGMEDAHEVAVNWQSDAEGMISLSGIREAMAQAAQALPECAANSYLKGVDNFINKNILAPQEQQ